MSKVGISEKLDSGPIIFPKPGPTTDTAVIPADREVTKSYPDREKTVVIRNTPDKNKIITVSYTHLTLPTNREV